VSQLLLDNHGPRFTYQHGEISWTTEKFLAPVIEKVGKEGYIHGYICVRPPCGPQYTEATFDSSKGTVSHDGTRIGKMRKNPGGTYSMTHFAADGAKTKLTAEHATRAEAALSVGLFHGVDTMHREVGAGPAKDALGEAREALVTGDRQKAIDSLTRARNIAEDSADRSLMSHVDHVRSVLMGEGAVEPKALDDGAPAVPDRGAAAAELLNSGRQLGDTPYERQLKEDIQAWTKAPEYPGKAMKEALDNAPGNAPALYRGMRAGRGTVPYDQLGVMATAKPGDAIDMPASSWSSDANIATGIARGRGPMIAPQFRRNVILALEPGSHSLNVEPHAGDYAYQREWATGGKLEVTRPPTTDADGVVTVHVRQAKTLSGVDTTEEKPSLPQAPTTIPSSVASKSTAPLSDDPPQWLQDANDENQRLGDLLDAERTSDFHGFTPKGEEIRRQQELLMMGDPWADDDDPNRNGAEGRAMSEGISRATQGKALLLAIGKRNRAHVAAENSMTPEAMDTAMTDEVKKAVAGRRVAVRVTNGALGKIIDDNAFKTQFETNRSAGLKSNDRRAALEETQFGYPRDLDPSLRPIYGYLDEGYDRPAGVGSKYMGDFNTDRLSAFGTTQVVLKDAVKNRATFNIGDSMDDQYSSMPSRLSDPQARSFAAYGKSDGGLGTSGVLRGVNRKYDSSEFRGGAFIEAQIHSPDGKARPLTPADIDHVIFPATPPADLRQKLSDAGISWQVKNAKTIAKTGTPEEVKRALSEYREDLVRAHEQVKFYQRLEDSQAAKGLPRGNWDDDIAAVNKIITQLDKNVKPLEEAAAKSS
jgi:hypothetical protein